MQNMLSGPAPSSLSGPPAALQGALGIAPASNMLSAPQGPPAPSSASPNMLSGAPGQPALQPPSREQLIDVAHRTSYVNATLRDLMAKPNLTERDVIDAVGEMIAEQVMTPMMAAKYLADLPDGPPQVRQWVMAHYANSAQTLSTVTQMIGASGRLSRAPAPPMQMPPPPAANLLSGISPNG